MSATADTPEVLPARAEPAEPRQAWRALALRHAGLPVVIVISLALNTYSLAKNAFANTFYAATVASMLRSLHNFLYASFDPGGLATIDKPPLALWAQAISAKVFGFSPLALLMPQALLGVGVAIAVYVVTARLISPAAGFAAGLTTAVFPSLVAVSRENGVDPMLIFTMTLAACAAVAATRSGRWRSLLASAAFVGLAFNTKTLAAVLIVPAIAAAYLVCAPGTLARRALRLLAAGGVMLVVGASWIALVELTPAHTRPYVGSSKNNTELGLTFEYNGFGRLEGEYGGPGGVKSVSDGRPHHIVHAPAPARWRHEKQFETKYMQGITILPGGRRVGVIPFGGPVGLTRMFGYGLGDQGGWLLPLGLFGLVALAAATFMRARRRDAPAARFALPSRRDPWLAFLIVFGGWLLIEYAVLSFSKGIIHPYYTSALAPAVGAMAGAGIVAISRMLRGNWRAVAVTAAVLAFGLTAAAQVHLMNEHLYAEFFIPVLIAGTAICLLVLALLRRYSAAALSVAFGLVLVVPTAYAATTWEAPVQGTFPAAGPRNAMGVGYYGVERGPRETYEQVIRYVRTADRPRRYGVLTVSSLPAATIVLLGGEAAALAGYGGTDPFSATHLAQLIGRGEARYVLVGGPFWNRGGNEATRAVVRYCTLLEPEVWQAPYPKTFGLELYDCAGVSDKLAGYERTVVHETLDDSEAARTKRESRAR